MKCVIRSIALAATAVTLFAATTAASAETFQYSYTFTEVVRAFGTFEGTKTATVTGTFHGTENGNLVTDLSRITASVNGYSLNGGNYLDAYGWAFMGLSRNDLAQASFDGNDNNFIFTTANGDESFAYWPDNARAAELAIIGENGFLVATDKLADPSMWSLSVVPEADTYAMLIAGLGLLGFMARRKKA